MRHLPLSIALLLPVSVSAGVYKWVDENGKVHFGDRPVANAQEVTIRDTAPPAPPPPAAAPDAHAPVEEGYQRLTITAPKSDHRLAGRDLVVEFTSEPALKKGDTFAVLLNGTPIMKGLTESPARLSGIQRGGSVEVVIEGPGGVTLLRSGAVTIQP